MSELESRYFEKVVADPNPVVTKTEIMVSMAQLGMLRAFDPDEADRVKDVNNGRGLKANRVEFDDHCKSNPHPVLNAADINSRRRGGEQNGRK